MNVQEMNQMLTAIFGDINNLPHTDLFHRPNVHPLALAQQHINLAVVSLRRYQEAVEKDTPVNVADVEGAADEEFAARLGESDDDSVTWGTTVEQMKAVGIDIGPRTDAEDCEVCTEAGTTPSIPHTAGEHDQYERDAGHD